MSVVTRLTIQDLGLAKPHFSPGHNALELHLGREYALSHGGLLPDDAFWDYLRMRHAVNPVRFDHYHPRIAGLVDRDEQVRGLLSPPTPTPLPLAVPPTVLHSRPVVSTPREWPPPGSAPGASPLVVSVPEPSPVALLATALAAVAVFRWIHRRLRPGGGIARREPPFGLRSVPAP
jgi:hypothetical protein